MLPLERRKWLEQQIIIDKKIDIDDVSRKLNVSAMTIRRDLNELESEGKLVRTHGGAVIGESLTKEMSYSSKKNKNKLQKQSIALKALSLIKENSTILLDSGTTTIELAMLLKDRKDLTIVTNDIKIGNELLNSSVKVLITGGVLQQEVGSLYGYIAQQFLDRIHVDLLFLGAHAIDLNYGVTAPTFEKAAIKQMMIKSAARTLVLADFSKFEKKAFANVCTLEKIDGIITDSRFDLPLRSNYEEKTSLFIGGEK